MERYVDDPLDRDRWHAIAAILDAVLELPAEARASHLDEACRDNPELRQTIEELIAASAAPESFLSVPAVERAAPLLAGILTDLDDRSISSAPGGVVGAYRLVRELGEGGMGVVWLGERADGQFQQQVAIKIVKQGIRGGEAQRRFVQERQILARLQHPAIARLLDGGVTNQGTPYFVMERVEGRTVTTYCQERRLGLDERLRVFLQICDAVQYAHRNLIVHCDLKPSNILVDNDGRVKLLDFGIAKLLGDAERAPGQPPQTIERALTPEYAAPEQLRGEPVSTSTDIYALGVLLYELLTGERPYRLRSSGIVEVQRAVLEQVPLSPSTRVASTELRRRLRGDLDRIVLKALQKSSDLRYPSAEAFSTDVRRYLDGLPVTARGSALSYRARKFLGRHRIGFGAALLLVLSLVGGLIATSWQARRAEREARKAEMVKEFLKTIFSAANPERTSRAPTVRELLDTGARRIETELRDQPEVQSEVAHVIADAYQALGEYDGVTMLLNADLERRRRADGPRSLAVAELLRQIADALYEQSRYEAAGAMYEEAMGIVRERRGERNPEFAELLWDVAGVKRNRGDLSGAEAFLKQSLAVYGQTKGDNGSDAMSVRESLSITYMQRGRFREAGAFIEPVAAWRERHLGPDHPFTLNARYNLAYQLHGQGRYSEAVRMSEDVVARQRRVLGARHDRLAGSLRLLARALDSAGRSEEALSPIAEALAIHIERFGPENPQVAHDRTWQALVEAHTGRLGDAERDSREALRIFDAQTGPPRADLPNVRMWLGIVLAEAGRLDEADAVVSRAVSDLRGGQQGLFLGLALDALAEIARVRAQPARALDLAREALPLVERGLGGEHPATPLARVHAGAAEWSSGESASGEALLRTGVEQLQRQFPAGHADLAAAWLIFGEALSAHDRVAEAHPLLQQAVAWRQAHFGPADPRTVRARQALNLSHP